jgi:hypothetical protein
MDGNGNNSQAPSTVLTLSITLDQATGQVGVNGPIQNPMICMGMLEMAKKAIHDFSTEQAKGARIVPAKSMPFIQH